MSEKLKHPNSLFDAEALASHISIMTSQSDIKTGKSGGTNKKLNMKSSQSQSGVKDSKNESETSSVSGSMVKTNQFSTDTGAGTGGGGDFGNIKAKDIQYSKEELPDSMMKAIRIIERLLTQSKYHHEHVLYKNYPPVDNLAQAPEDEDDQADANQNRMMPFGGGDKKKKDDEKEEANEVKEEDEDKVSLTHLFKFKCDVTDGTPVTCMDINSANPDLIAVSYGEYDIDCTQQLKQGILAFWTLKNPTFPEKIIYHEHSITSCQFSKRNPHLIAIGDSHGNIAIFNIRSEDYNLPIAESKDLDGKHTDIIWEIQWVDRDAKGEALVSISGDGRVIEWSMKKGLEMSDLTQLKRETNPNQKDVFQSAAADEGKEKKGGMTFISTGGLSIDFPAKQNGITYYAATEDCSIHQCSVSYPDQYLENYYGH